MRVGKRLITLYIRTEDELDDVQAAAFARQIEKQVQDSFRGKLASVDHTQGTEDKFSWRPS